MWKRIREIMIKELRQTVREPRMRLLLFVPPMIQLIVFGYAVNLDVEDSHLAWLDRDGTPASRELRADFEGSTYFRIVRMVGDRREAQDLIDRGEASLIVSILPGFQRDLERGDTAAVQILVDGSNSNTASVAASYASRVVARFSAHYLEQRQRSFQMGVVAASGRDGPRALALPTSDAQTRVWFNEDLRSRNYYVPGILVNIITLVTLTLTTLSIVREKEIGTMEQLMVTPVRSIELMLGKTLPFGAIGLVQTALVTGVGLLLFGVPFRGSPLILLVSMMIFLMTTLGAGLFISTISGTQQQAMMGSFFFFMPAFMLSGFAFPIRNMPVAVQYLSFFNPVRYMMEICRGLFLKGVGVETLWPQMAALTVYGTIVLTLSVMRFHKRLD